MTATEEFVSKFHQLDGKTIGEKRKNLFLLLNNTKDVNQIDFTEVHPQNFLEEKFKIDLLLHFKRTSDLVEILKSERPLQIERILKRSQWFIEELFSAVTVEELITTVFPNSSFRTKIKIINKLAIYLNDSDKAHGYFEAVDKQYGTYLASKLLPSCRSDYILNFLNSRHFKPTPKQALTIIKRYPEITEEVIDILMKFDDARDEYVNVFDHIKLHNIKLLVELNEKHCLSLRLGWRTTDKYVHSNQEMVVSDPKKYYRMLHKKQIGKSLYRNFNALFIKLFPRELDNFSYEINTIVSVLKNLPKRLRQGNLIVSNFEKLYGSSFWTSEYVSLEILELLTADEREKAVEIGKKPKDVVEEKWKSYLKTDKSLPFLKKQISLSSKITTRATLVECLVATCKINADDKALLNVCDYMLKVHRNDHIKVRKSFLNAIQERYDLDKLTEVHWKCINEFINIFELNDETFENTFKFRKFYVRYKLLNNLPIDEELLKWVRAKHTDFTIFENNPQLQLHCFKLFSEIIGKELKGDDLATLNITLLQSVRRWNEKHKEKFSLFTFEDAVSLLKGKFVSDNYDYADVNILNDLIKEDYQRNLSHSLITIYLGLSEKYGNIDILTWLIQNYPSVVDENLDAIVAVFVKAYSRFYREHYFFKYVKNYPSIHQKVVGMLSNASEADDLRSSLLALSTTQIPEQFIDRIQEYFPTEKQADPKSEAGRELYATQEIVARCLKNLDPPSTSMSSILKFCKGDYLKLILATLYSLCDNINETKLIPFLSELINQAVSVRKHALHLTFRVLDKNQVYSLVKHFMEKEKNDSIRKFIFKGCFNFFVKNPDNFTWELVKLNLKAVDINDTEAIDILIQFEKVPKEYKSKYIVLTWEVLNAVPDVNSTLDRNLANLIDHISPELIPELPQEFYDKVINSCFLKDDYSVVSFLSSRFNTFVCKYILYSSSDSEKRDRLNAIFVLVKDYVLKSWSNSSVRPLACKSALDFLKEFCLPFLKDECDDKELFNEFFSLWNDFLQPYQFFEEYLHLKCVDLYLESLAASELGSRLGELCDTLVNTYGDIIIGMFCNKINYFRHYFFKNGDEDDGYDFIDSLINEDSSTSCLILAIFLLTYNNPTTKREKRRYDEIIEKLENVDNVTVKLYTNSLIGGNVNLHFDNY